MSSLPKTMVTTSNLADITSTDDPDDPKTLRPPSPSKFEKLAATFDPKNASKIVHLTTTQSPYASQPFEPTTTSRPPTPSEFRDLAVTLRPKNPSEIDDYTTPLSPYSSQPVEPITISRPPSPSEFKALAAIVDPPNPSKTDHLTTPRPPNASEIAKFITPRPPKPEETYYRNELREKGDIHRILGVHFKDEDDEHRILTAFLTRLPAPGREKLARLLIDEDAKTGAAGLHLIAEDLERKVLVPLKTAHYPPLNRQTFIPLGLRQTVLPRDGYRCVITHTVDARSAEVFNLPPPDPAKYPKAIPPANVFLTRIMPKMALPGTPAGNEGQENQKKDEKKEYKERRESVDLTELCFPGLRKKCAPGMADQEGNILSLFENMGHMFGKFAVGLQASEEPHTYEIITFRGFKGVITGLRDSRFFKDLLPTDRSVCFAANSTVQLPDPELLEVHLSVGKILEETEKGKEIDKALNKWWKEKGRKGGQEGKEVEGVLQAMDELKENPVSFLPLPN